MIAVAVLSLIIRHQCLRTPMKVIALVALVLCNKKKETGIKQRTRGFPKAEEAVAILGMVAEIRPEVDHHPADLQGTIGHEISLVMILSALQIHSP